MDPRLLNWGGEGYPAYEVEMKVSGQEKAMQQQNQLNAQWLSDMMQRQFTEQQSLLNNFLVPQLKQMVTNPQGFGNVGLANMRSQLISTIGSQLTGLQQNLRQQFDTANMAGLGSGVQVGLGANLAQTAAGQEAAGLQNIAIANAQARMTQQLQGLQGLQGATSLLGAAPQSAGLATQAAGQAWNEAYQQAQQGGFWSNLARGALGGAEMLAGMALPGGGTALGGLLGKIPGLGGIFGQQQTASISAPVSGGGQVG